MLLERGAKTGLLLLAGDPPSGELLRTWTEASALFVCADGAARRRLPRTPDAVVGDMDSIGPPGEGLPLIPMMGVDSTDSEKGLRYLADAGCDRVILLGGTGGRQDHHLVNLALPLTEPGKILLAAEDFEAVGVEGRRTFRLPPGRGLSLFPLFGPVSGVGLHGVEFPLDGVELDRIRGRNGSNRVTDSLVEVEAHSGRLLLIVERRPGDPLWRAKR